MTRLSNRQYPLFKAFSDGSYMSVETARLYDQRPFRSMLVRGWITFYPKHGFQITEAGQKAWLEFQSTEIWRLHPSRPLTAYFDPAAYRLHGRRAKVHTMKQGAA
jgi:hypothetical protein